MYSRVRSPDQAGSAVLLVVIAGVFAGAILIGGTHLASNVTASARARTAADAAALAATVDQQAARRAVTQAGGEVLTLQHEGSVVVAVVDVDGQQARAAATKPAPAGGVGERSGLAPAMLAALGRADELLDQAVPIVSGYRNSAHQQELWDRRHLNTYPVARPGTSKHELGLAVDVPLWFVPRLRTVALFSGLCHPLPDTDPVHFVVCPILR